MLRVLYRPASLKRIDSRLSRLSRTTIRAPIKLGGTPATSYPRPRSLHATMAPAAQPKASSSTQTAAPQEWCNLPLFSGLPPLPAVKGAEPARIALDAFRIAAAVQVAEIFDLGKDAEALEKTLVGIEAGKKDADLQLAVPRFRLKGDPKALAKKLADEVRDDPVEVSLVEANRLYPSSNPTTTFPRPKPPAFSSPLISISRHSLGSCLARSTNSPTSEL